MIPHVLVVEDDPHVREMLIRRLDTRGYEVTAFADGRECWEWLQDAEHGPDAILSDGMLPGLDGFALLKRIGEHQYIDIPVIMVTARGTEADTIRAFELGADDYVTKPFSPSEVIARLSRLI